MKKNNITLKDFIIDYYKIDEENKRIHQKYEMTKLEEECFKLLI